MAIRTEHDTPSTGSLPDVSADHSAHRKIAELRTTVADLERRIAAAAEEAASTAESRVVGMAFNKFARLIGGRREDRNG